MKKKKETVWTRVVVLTIGSDGSVVMETGIEDANIELHHDCIDRYKKEKFDHYSQAFIELKEFHQEFINSSNESSEELLKSRIKWILWKPKLIEDIASDIVNGIRTGELQWKINYS